jgi:RNA polymerase sigma factor (TIGR02999 family)
MSSKPDIPAQVDSDATSPGAVTALLLRCRAADEEAVERLYVLVYDHLRDIAHAHLNREAQGHTLCTTGLVHEAFVKLVDPARVEWQDRQHFLALASRTMRHVLTDYARRHRAAKRGGDWQRVDLDAVQIAVVERADALLSLDEALTRLAVLRPRLGLVVELRFFGGLTEEETAEALGITDRTVRRDWIKARGWLHQELEQSLDS